MSEVAAVMDANDAFYQAIRLGDLEIMETLWARKRQVTCTHPGTHMLTGRSAVMASWASILSGHPLPEIHAFDAEAIVTGNSALVLCVERFSGIELMATNSFAVEDGAWRLLNHHASRMTAEQA
jgi:hypothetical protein